MRMKIFSKKFYEEIPATSESRTLSVTDSLQSISIPSNEEWQINNLVISNGATASDFVISDNGTQVFSVHLAANQVLVVNFLEIPVLTRFDYQMSAAGATATVVVNYKRIVGEF